MRESVNVENKKQSRQKPPLNVGRIIGEILVGTLTGLVVAMPFVYVLVAGSGGDCFGVGKLIAAAAGFLIVPPVYALAASIGVYIVGSRGNQTGLFLATLGGGLVGLPVSALLYIDVDMAEDMMLGIVKIVLWSLVYLTTPMMATLCFNLTRRYKEPASD